MRLEDERGNRWLVLNGDPAYQYVKHLEKLNYSWIILTKAAFCGIMHERPGNDEQLLPPGSGQVTPDSLIVRAVRLSDCMAAVRKFNGDQQSRSRNRKKSVAPAEGGPDSSGG